MAQNMSAREILEKLVSFQTVSRDSNLALIDWVEAYLASHGVVAERVYNDAGDKAGLYANVGPEVAGGIVLSGHSDVVPVDGQDWDSDPFTVTEKDGKLFGRGTCDMKGFIAIALAAVPKALDARVKRPLQIAISYDEEVGCVGAPRLIAQMAETLPRAAAAVIGEPTEMQVVTGNKGGMAIETVVHGFEVHSSLMHTGVNAVMTAARLIDWANEQNAVSMKTAPSDVAGLFEPPWTTAHVGTVQGGTAENITARHCRFIMTFRPVPDEPQELWRDRYLAKVKEIEAEISAIRPEAWIETHVYFQVPGLTPEPEGAAETLARRLSGDNATHVVSYATEAGQFQEAGYSAVICGPGNIEQAHQPNEWLSVEEFEKGIAFIDRVVESLTT